MKKSFILASLLLIGGVSIYSCQKEETKESNNVRISDSSQNFGSGSFDKVAKTPVNNALLENEILRISQEIPPLYAADIALDNYNSLSYNIRPMTTEEVNSIKTGGIGLGGNGDDIIQPRRLCKDQGQGAGFAKCVAAAVKKLGCVKLLQVGEEIHAHTCD